MNRCLACGSLLVEPFYNPGPQPLAAFNLPATEEAAKNAQRFPMNFHVCLICGHVFNVDFSVAQVPYGADNNLMYNAGAAWDLHVVSIAVDVAMMATSIRDSRECDGPVTIVDIGAGDGGFLEKLAALLPETDRLIAYEPGTASADCEAKGLETVRDYFIPERDIKTVRPDIMVCRHVFEHLENPQEFAGQLARYSAACGVDARLYVEVPCIDKAIQNHRLEDFLYEHVSNFTWFSLPIMMSTAGWETIDTWTVYNDEVIVWCGYAAHQVFTKHLWSPQQTLTQTRRDLEEAKSYYRPLILWGGTGKSASFINTLRLGVLRVVDSDPAKVGKRVPGTGQLIESSDVLASEGPSNILITTRWRAADIYSEILDKGIPANVVLVVEDSRVVQYTKDMYEQEKA